MMARRGGGECLGGKTNKTVVVDGIEWWGLGYTWKKNYRSRHQPLQPYGPTTRLRRCIVAVTPTCVFHLPTGTRFLFLFSFFFFNFFLFFFFCNHRLRLAADDWPATPVLATAVQYRMPSARYATYNYITTNAYTIILLLYIIFFQYIIIIKY